jgi:hypothetical protein
VTDVIVRPHRVRAPDIAIFLVTGRLVTPHMLVFLEKVLVRRRLSSGKDSVHGSP